VRVLRARVFNAPDRTRRFCSRQCRGESVRKVRPRPCAGCGEAFTPVREGQLCCSYKCSRDHRRPEARACEFCKKGFQPERVNGPRFCSRACSGAARRTSSGLLDRMCGSCPKVFHPKSERHRFCSRACFQRSQVKVVDVKSPVLYIGGEVRKRKLRADLFALQKGVCAACSRELLPGRGTMIDHCHSAGHARALLCNGCNTALGMCGESAERLRALADYADRCATVLDALTVDTGRACIADGWSVSDVAVSARVPPAVALAWTEAQLNADDPDTKVIEKPA
jgi:hypothetical protein